MIVEILLLVIVVSLNERPNNQQNYDD